MTQAQPITIQPSATSVFRKRIFPRYKTKADGTVPVLNRVTYAQAGFGLGFLASISVPIYKLFKGDESTSFWGKLFGTYLGPAFLAMLNVVGIASCAAPKNPFVNDLFTTAAKILAERFQQGISADETVRGIFDQSFKNKLHYSLSEIIYSICLDMGPVEEDNPNLEIKELANEDEDPFMYFGKIDKNEYNRFVRELQEFRNTVKTKCSGRHTCTGKEYYDFKRKFTESYEIKYFNYLIYKNRDFAYKVFPKLFNDGLPSLERCFNEILNPHGLTLEFRYDKSKSKLYACFTTTSVFSHHSVQNENYKPFIALMFENPLEQLPGFISDFVSSFNELEDKQGQSTEILNKRLLGILHGIFANFNSSDNLLAKFFGQVLMRSYGPLFTGIFVEDQNGKRIRSTQTDNTSALGGIEHLPQIKRWREEIGSNDFNVDLLLPGAAAIVARATKPKTPQSDSGAGDPPVDSGDSGPQPLKFKVVKDETLDPSPQSPASVASIAESSTDSVSQSPKTLEDALSELQFQIDPAKDGEKKSLMKYLLIKAWVLVNCQGERAKAITEELDKSCGILLAEEAKKIHLQFVSKEKQVVFPKEFRSLDQLLEVYGDKLSDKDLRDIVFELFASAPILRGEYEDYKAKLAKKGAPIS